MTLARTEGGAGSASMLRHRTGGAPRGRAHVARRDDLTSRHDDLFLAVDGCSFGVRKPFYEALGGFDESIGNRGGEDIELAWRACTAGALLVPAWGRRSALRPPERGAGGATARRRKAVRDRQRSPI